MSRSNPKPKPDHILAFEAIGTQWTIEIYEPVTNIDGLQQLIAQRIDAFDRNYSRFRQDSLVTKMSRQAGDYRLPKDAKPLLDLYRQMYDLSDGEVTPLVGQTLSDAGYDMTYSLEPDRPQTSPEWSEVLEYDFPNLKLKSPTLLDFGAAGKGYLVDIVAAILRDHNLLKFCVDAGGDMVVGNQSITVGLEHPDDPEQAIGVIKLANHSLCGSAGNRRTWDKYHHIISPSRVESPRHIKAVWALADTTLLADILTTALYFVPARKLQKHYNFEYMIVNDDYSFDKSAGFSAEVFV